MSRFDVRLIALAGSVALALVPARADTVTDWNERAVAVLVAENLLGGGTASARTFAMMHSAMFDVVLMQRQLGLGGTTTPEQA